MCYLKIRTSIFNTQCTSPSVNPINQLETIEMRDGSIVIGSSIARFLFILFLSDRILSFSQSVILLAPLAKAATLILTANFFFSIFARGAYALKKNWRAKHPSLNFFIFILKSFFLSSLRRKERKKKGLRKKGRSRGVACS